MAKFRGDRIAFGKPGIEPRWSQGAKDGVGTAYATSSRMWFTLWNGILTETYYSTIDRPQIRELQYLITDGKSFFHEEKRHLKTQMERPWSNALAYHTINSDPEGRYQIEKEIITDPHLSCVLQNTKVRGDFLSQLRLYALCAPHLEVGGRRERESTELQGYCDCARNRGRKSARSGIGSAIELTAPIRRF